MLSHSMLLSNTLSWLTDRLRRSEGKRAEMLEGGRERCFNTSYSTFSLRNNSAVGGKMWIIEGDAFCNDLNNGKPNTTHVPAAWIRQAKSTAVWPAHFVPSSLLSRDCRWQERTDLLCGWDRHPEGGSQRHHLHPAGVQWPCLCSTSELWLSYGHPSGEKLKFLNQYTKAIYQTCQWPKWVLVLVNVVCLFFIQCDLGNNELIGCCVFCFFLYTNTDAGIYNKKRMADIILKYT